MTGVPPYTLVARTVDCCGLHCVMFIFHLFGIIVIRGGVGVVGGVEEIMTTEALLISLWSSQY